MYSELMFGKGDFVVDLHFVEEPVRVALENLGQMRAEFASGFAKAVHDAAQRGFMNSQHARQTILPDAGGVHPQFQVGINVSIQAQVIALVFCRVAALQGTVKAVTAICR
jgi:hypothetical protein